MPREDRSRARRALRPAKSGKPDQPRGNKHRNRPGKPKAKPGGGKRAIGVLPVQRTIESLHSSELREGALADTIVSDEPREDLILLGQRSFGAIRRFEGLQQGTELLDMLELGGLLGFHGVDEHLVK